MSDIRPVVEVHVEASRTGDWRRLVVQHDTTLTNLHRIIQASLKKTATDASIAAMPFSFSHRGAEVKGPTTASLAAKGGPTFMSGKEPLQYTAGKAAAFTITARTRGEEAVAHFVPRCIAGSFKDHALHDAVNSNLMRMRFSKDASRNKQPRQLPSFFAPPWVSRAELTDRVLHGPMRAQVKGSKVGSSTAVKNTQGGASPASKNAAGKTAKRATAAQKPGATKKASAAKKETPKNATAIKKTTATKRTARAKTNAPARRSARK